MTRHDLAFVVLLLAALALRLHLASTESYLHDEENTAIPLARSISFNPDHLRLPLRGINHPALPAYFVKAGSSLVGATPVGYRAAHIGAGLATLVLIYLLARQAFGPVAALWAAALLAFNEYYLSISARATAHAPHLLFLAGAIYAFARFLDAGRVRLLYMAAVCVGIAFYCKEHSALLLPIFFITLLLPANRRWLRQPHVYLAAALFVLTITPDLYWNATRPAETSQATYSRHIQRLGGVGFSPYPTMFYARTAMQRAAVAITGRDIDDNTPEYPSMNPALGLLLLAAVCVTTFGDWRRDRVTAFLLLVFWGVFGFFTVIRRPAEGPPGLDPVSWIWVDVTMLAAVVLTGAALARTRGLTRAATWTFGAVTLGLAVLWTLQ